MSKRKMSEFLAHENRALLEKLSGLEKALTRNSVDSLKEITRSFEEQLFLHRRREEEALFPVLSRHLSRDGEPVSRRRIEGREHGDRLKDLRSYIHSGRRGDFLYRGQLFVTFLREHLVGADNILIPLAMRLLSSEEWDQIRRGFESIGGSLHAPGPPVAEFSN